MFRYLSFDIDSVQEKHSDYFSYRKFLWSVVFALVFVNLPWQTIKGAEFTDIENYIVRFSTEFNPNSLVSEGGIVEYITSEYLWAVMIASLENFGLSLPLVFKSISFFSILVLGFFIFKKTNNITVTSLLLFNPLLIDFVMSQIRNSFALSVIILGLMSTNKWIKLILLLSSTMIHSSSIILIAILFFSNREFFSKKTSNSFMLIIFGVLIALILTVGKDYILSLIGDRRAQIDEPASSLLYGLFWIIFGIFTAYIRKFNFHDIYTKFSIVLLLIFTASILFGTYASRYIAIGLPFIIISVWLLSKPNRTLVTSVLLLYQIVLFSYWIQ